MTILILCGLLWHNPQTHTTVRVCYARDMLVHRRIGGVAPVAPIA